jgi:uncharacterized Zn finger protein
MTQFSRIWWGQRFIAALEKIMDSGRLSCGRWEHPTLALSTNT